MKSRKSRMDRGKIQIDREIWRKKAHFLLSDPKFRQTAFDYLRERLEKGSVSEFFMLKTLLRSKDFGLDFPVSDELKNDAYRFLAKNLKTICSGAVKNESLARHVAMDVIMDDLPKVLLMVSDEDLMVMYAFLVRNFLSHEANRVKILPEKSMPNWALDKVSEKATKCLYIYGGVELMYGVTNDKEKFKMIEITAKKIAPKAREEAKDKGIVVEMGLMSRMQEIAYTLSGKIKERVIGDNSLPTWSLYTVFLTTALLEAMGDPESVKQNSEDAYARIVFKVAEKTFRNRKKILGEMARVVSVVDDKGFVAGRLREFGEGSVGNLKRNLSAFGIAVQLAEQLSSGEDCNVDVNSLIGDPDIDGVDFER